MTGNINEDLNKNEKILDNKTENNENMNKAKKKIGILLIVSLLIGGIFLTYWFVIGRNYVETDNAYTNGIQNIVTAQVNGNIKKINIEDTQIVKEGDLLLEIEDIDYKIALEKASANLSKIVRAYFALEADVVNTKENLSSKEADLKKSELDYKRDKVSYKLGLISKMQFDQSERNYVVSKAYVAQAKKMYENSLVQANIKSDIRNHPDVKEAIANYKQASLNLIRTKVFATTSGVIAKKSIFLGQRISSGQNLFSIIDLNSVWVDANMKEDQLRNIKVGNEVEMESDLNKKIYKGIIVGVSGGSGSSLSVLPAQNATGNWIKISQRVPVKILIEKASIEENGILPIGTSMNVRVDINKISPIPEKTSRLEQKFYNLEEERINLEIDEIIKSNML